MAFAGEYDFVIIGAGIAGLAVAYFYKEQFPSHRVLILERNKVGGGLSGKSGGHLMPGFEADYGEMERILGKDRALQLYKETVSNTTIIENVIRKHNIDAGFKRGYWIVDTAPEEFAKLAEFMKPRRLLDLEEPRLFQGEELRANVNIGSYDAGLFFPDIPFIETPKLLYGLEKAVKDMGVEICCGTEYEDHKQVRSFQNGHPYRVLTKRSDEIKARRILLAGGDILTRHNRSLNLRTATIYTARIGVHLDAEDFKTLSPLQTSFAGCDTDLKNNASALEGDLWFSMRRDGYFILGFGGTPEGFTHSGTQTNVKEMQAEVLAEAHRLLPFLRKKDYSVRVATGGLNTSSNLFPILENLDGNGAYAIAALSGIGLNQSVLLARALVMKMKGDHRLFDLINQLKSGQVIIPRNQVLRRAAIGVGMAALRPGILQPAAIAAVEAAKVYSRLRF